MSNCSLVGKKSVVSGTEAGEHKDFHFIVFVDMGFGKTCCHLRYWLGPKISFAFGLEGLSTVNHGDKAVVGDSVAGSSGTDPARSFELKSL